MLIFPMTLTQPTMRAALSFAAEPPVTLPLVAGLTLVLVVCVQRFLSGWKGQEETKVQRHVSRLWDEHKLALKEGAVAAAEAASSDDDEEEKKVVEPRRSKPPRVTQPKPTEQRQPPSFLPALKKHEHVLESFWHWFDVEASLYRIYTSNYDEVPPYNPSSRRGTVRVHLRVLNATDALIHVYWINYKGGQEDKGVIQPGDVWHQTTWIDHPWVFAQCDETLLDYIPYRVIPTIDEAVTVEEEDGRPIAVHKFAIGKATDSSGSTCSVQDEIFPHPASQHLTSPSDVLQFALRHCLRSNYLGYSTLLQYLEAIVKDPANPRLRQIRTANRIFHDGVWSTPGRGVLFAVGFRENLSHVELGSTKPLSRVQVADLARAIDMIQTSKERSESADGSSAQPEGADGHGRAGYNAM